MVMYKKVYDPGATSRRLNVIVRHPDTLAGLSEIPYRQEAVLIDFILQEWMQRQAEGKSVQDAVSDGTLARNIEAALHQAKKGRVGSTVPVQASSPPSPVRPASTAVSSQPSPMRDVSTQSTAVPPTAQAPVPQAPPSPPSPSAATTSPPAAEPVQRTVAAPQETPEETRGDGDEPPPPPAHIAAALSRMFDPDN